VIVDGGGGPTRQMIERLNRVQNVDGMPQLVFFSFYKFNNIFTLFSLEFDLVTATRFLTSWR
jgi:hypothetical protein